MLKIGKTYMDGWGGLHRIASVGAANPAEWVKADSGAVFRVVDGRKCIWDSIARRWHCPLTASRWDLDPTSER